MRATGILKSDLYPMQDELIELNSHEMPFLNSGEAADAVHPLARKSFDKTGAADELLISVAEHNGHRSAAFKNIFDQASRIDEKAFR